MTDVYNRIPRRGDLVWVEYRPDLVRTDKKGWYACNGVIIRVSTWAENVLVYFGKGDTEEYSFEELSGNYDSRYRRYSIYDQYSKIPVHLQSKALEG